MAEPGTRKRGSDELASFGHTPGVNMSKSPQSLKVLAVVIGACALGACQSLGALPTEPAAKVDNGLGELPHYRDWIDPTGRMPMEPVSTAHESTRWP
jgi:hypothetical protein